MSFVNMIDFRSVYLFSSSNNKDVTQFKIYLSFLKTEGKTSYLKFGGVLRRGTNNTRPREIMESDSLCCQNSTDLFATSL